MLYKTSPDLGWQILASMQTVSTSEVFLTTNLENPSLLLDPSLLRVSISLGLTKCLPFPRHRPAYIRLLICIVFFRTLPFSSLTDLGKVGFPITHVLQKNPGFAWLGFKNWRPHDEEQTTADLICNVALKILPSAILASAITRGESRTQNYTKCEVFWLRYYISVNNCESSPHALHGRRCCFHWLVHTKSRTIGLKKSFRWHPPAVPESPIMSLVACPQCHSIGADIRMDCQMASKSLRLRGYWLPPKLQKGRWTVQIRSRTIPDNQNCSRWLFLLFRTSRTTSTYNSWVFSNRIAV